MKISRFKWASVILVLAASASLTLADEPTLKIGDPAPKLQTGKFVQGEPVKEFQKGKAYLVDFWATWCVPCRESIPHLNETYAKFKDKNLVVIGQDYMEDEDALVAPFVKKMGAKMAYPIALDDKGVSKNGKMAETWMAAAGENTIPNAFLVDTAGDIAWIGRPMDLKDETIQAVLDGKYDKQKAAAERLAQKTREAQMEKLNDELNGLLQDKNWDAASAKLDELQKLLPAEQMSDAEMVRFTILLAKKEYPAAYKLAAQMSDANKTNTEMLDQLAWRIAADPTIEQRDRDLTLAETIATRGNEAAQGKDASLLDTLARIAFLQNKKDAAISFEEKALKAADEDQKPDIQKSLDSYKKGELPKPD